MTAAPPALMCRRYITRRTTERAAALLEHLAKLSLIGFLLADLTTGCDLAVCFQIVTDVI